MATVTFDHVSKRYGDVIAVNDLNLEIQDGEFMVLVGPSGCGKTTSLRMIAGLEEISSGTLKIGDRVVNDVAPKDRDIAMVFQSYALYPHMTVFDNLAFGLKLRKVKKDEIERRVNEAAKILDLGKLLKRKPKELSGGQRQRVAMGRAVVRRPRLFLFDEPLSNLDAALRQQMRVELLRLHRRLSTTTVYVTHDQVEAMTLAHRIVVLKQGALVQVGRPGELYDRPTSTFVARFFGSPEMNLVDGRVEGGVFHAAEEAAPLHIPVGSYPSGPATFGVRAEHLTWLAPDAPDAPIRGTVDVIENLGSDALAHVRVGGYSLVVRCSVESPPTAGSAAALAPHPERWHLFARPGDGGDGPRLTPRS
jgi:multiple sugar transport system ATP-binding protein